MHQVIDVLLIFVQGIYEIMNDKSNIIPDVVKEYPLLCRSLWRYSVRSRPAISSLLRAPTSGTAGQEVDRKSILLSYYFSFQFFNDF
jgi:hypothetical protein